MTDKSKTTMQHDDDQWWEMVFSAKDYIAMNRGCERGECFTFACQYIASDPRHRGELCNR